MSSSSENPFEKENHLKPTDGDQYSNSNEKVISSEPEPNNEMYRDYSGRSSMQTHTTDASGYHRESNECVEFCADLFICFGACDACCPASGEGCLTSTAAFCGNICVGMFKC